MSDALTGRRRALVTGAGGFVGRHLCALLLRSGWDVAGTVRSASTGIVGLDEHVVDLEDEPGLASVVRTVAPELVFHLAAVVDTVNTPDVLRLYRTNVLGTAAILEAARGVSSVRRLVVASSSFAYGRTSPEAQPVAETELVRPFTPYGISKAAAEQIALGWARDTGVDVVLTRAFQHTGPGHVGAYALADWSAQLASGTSEVRVGNIEVERDYLDVRDVAAAYLALAETGRAGVVYNVASGVPRTMRSLLDALIAAFDSPARIVPDPQRQRAQDQPAFYGDITRLTNDTAWRPSYSLEQTMGDLARWHQAQVLTSGG